MVYRVRISAAFCIICLILMVEGCISTPATDSLPDDKYVAIYEENNFIGHVVSNTSDRFLWIPTTKVLVRYDYDGSLGDHISGNMFLNGSYPDANDSFRILYGTWKFYDDPTMADHWAIVRSIDEFPYSCESGLIIWGIFKNGTINATYRDQIVLLGPGDEWGSVPVITVNETPERVWVGPGPMDSVYRNFTVEYNLTWTVKNMGVFDKSNMRKA